MTTKFLTNSCQPCKKKLPWMILLLCFMLTLSAHGKSNETGTENVFELIMSRVQAQHKSVNVNTTDNTYTKYYMGILKEDGSFPDIDYASTAQTNWNPLAHLDRMKHMVLSYTIPTSNYYANEGLYNQIVSMLNYWYDSDPRSTNWYNQQIAAPQRVGVLLILMRTGAIQLPAELEAKLLQRMVDIGGRPDQSGSPGTGANKIDIATHWIYRGCLTQDPEVLQFGADQVYFPVFLTTGEGLQHDFSYQQHGNQIHMGAYGWDFINGVSSIAVYMTGTPYAMTGEKLNYLSRFVLDGYMGTIRGQHFMYNVIGRAYSRPNGIVQSGFHTILNRMKNMDPDNSVKYDQAIARIRGEQPASYGLAPLNRNFWRSDYVLHQRPEYYFDIRGSSTYTTKNENGNGEGMKGYFLTDGATQIALTGTEYLNIFPVWDWTRIPGTTTPVVATIPTPTQWEKPGSSKFTGTASDGVYAVTTHLYNDPQYSLNTQAHKAWFMFDKEIVALGAGINSTNAQEINTTVNQALLQSDVWVKNNAGTTSKLNKTAALYPSTSWIHHSNVGYYFPKNTNINISNTTQTGKWSDINTGQSSNAVSTDVFKVWFNHGSKPNNQTYEYIVLPSMDLTAMQAYTPSNIDILQNDANIQAVRHKALDILGLVFYTAGTFEHEGVTVNVDKPCILMFRNISTDNVSIYLSDPSRNNSKIKVVAKFPALSELKEAAFTLATLRDAQAGNTVLGVLNASSPTGTPTVTPEPEPELKYIESTTIADAFVRGGVGENQNNGGTGYLTIRKDDNINNNYEVFVKYDISFLEKQNLGKIFVKLSMHSAGANVDKTSWAIMPTATDWTEYGITNANKPAPTSEALATLQGVAFGNTPKFDVTDYVKEQLALGAKQISFTIQGVGTWDGTHSAAFFSKENGTASNHPKLMAEVEESPLEPKYEYIESITTGDAFVRDGASYENINYGGNGYLTIKKDNVGYNNEVFAKFNLSFLDNQSVEKIYAKFSVIDGGASVPEATWTIKATDTNWIEKGTGGITNATKPTPTTDALSTLQGVPTGGDVMFDVTDYVKQQYALGIKDVSFTIQGVNRVADGKHSAGFASRENGDATKRPRLMAEVVAEIIEPEPLRVETTTIADAWVRDGANNENTNNGATGYLTIRKDDVNNNYEVFVKYDLSFLKNAKDIKKVNARFIMHSAGSSVAQTSWVIKGTDTNWEELKITDANKPAPLTEGLSTVPGVPKGSEVLFDVTNYVKQKLSEGATQISFTIQGVNDFPDKLHFAAFYSKEYGVANDRPRLMAEVGEFVEVEKPNLVLGSSLKAVSETINQGDTLTVNVSPKNIGGAPFSGDMALALTNENGEIANIVHQFATQVNLNAGEFWSLPIQAKWETAKDIALGTYMFKVVFRTSNQEPWTEIPTETETISNLLSITVAEEEVIIPEPELVFDTIKVLEDGWVRDGDYANNVQGGGTSATLVVKKDNLSYAREAYMKFDISSIDPTLYQKYFLKLSVSNSNESIADTKWAVSYISDNNWTETTLTWNNAPAKDYVVTVSPTTTAGNNIHIDITAAILDAISKGNKQISLHIASTERGVDGKTDAHFFSKENADANKAPQLLLAYKEPEPKSVETISIEDSFVQNGASNENVNNGTNEWLYVKFGESGYNREAFFKFDLSFLDNTYINKVTAKFYIPNAGVSAHEANWVIKGTPTNWAEMEITDANKPAPTTDALATAPAGPKGTIVEFDVTDYVKRQKALGATEVSFTVQSINDASDGKGQAWIASREIAIASQQPRLIAEIRGDISVVQSTWTPQAESTDWNDPQNWSVAVPGKTTKVTIPAGASSYPTIAEPTTVGMIYIGAGAELRGQDLLTYNKAFVDYDFGTETDRSIHFRMLAMPLMEAYHGDFTFGGKPNTYLQTLQIMDGRGKWTTLRGGNTTPFVAGTGFALSLDPDNSTTEGLGLAKEILRLPYFDADSQVDPKVHPTHSYDGNWSSKFNNPNDATQFYNVTRSQNAYKLAGEHVSTPLIFVASASGNQALVGNPFVTTIDFDKLYEANSSLIKNSYQVWTKVENGEGYIAYTPEGSFGIRSNSTLDRLIAPLQGFVVEQKENATGNLEFHLNTLTADQSGELRSQTQAGDKITIVAQNNKAKVSTFIARRSYGSSQFGKSDARKLMNNLTTVPEVYTLKPSDKGLISVGANITNTNEAEYPIGIATTHSGEITLTFSGMDTYGATQVTFVDKATNKTVNLTGMSSYDYTFNYTAPVVGGDVVPTDDRFVLRTTSSTSSVKNSLDNDEQSFAIYANKGFIHISSDVANPIREVSVYNLNGMLMYQANVNQTSYVTSQPFTPGTYIVKVKNNFSVKDKKVVVR